MDRKQFIQNSLIIGGATILPANSSLAASVNESGIDKLVDENGNFIQQTLPYAENFLEPYMDAETMHLHYTFHHGGAVKGANNDLKKVKEALDSNNLETIDFWTKKLSFHFSSHILHCVAALATFLPCYLLTVIPAPYFKRIAKNKSIKAFVDGITAAVIGALVGAVVIIASRSITDIPSALIAIATILALIYLKKIQESYIILIAAVIGLILKTVL
jgi:predicted 2-oxoglutarate/Fe(II)-dependent dioxygenase YbiX